MNEKLSIGGVYNLTPMQEGMLFHTYLNPESTAYFEQFSCIVSGQLDVGLLESSFNALIEKYDVLRLNFLHENMKNPKQIVFKKRVMSIFYENVSHLDEAEQVQYIQRFVQADQKKGFDLAKDMLLRAAVLQMDDHRYKLIWSYHHIIMDGWCLKTIVQELFEVYGALSKGEAVELDEAPPFASYIQWLDRQNRDEARNYWADYLQGHDSTIELSSFGMRSGGIKVRDGKARTSHEQQEDHLQVDCSYKISEETTHRLEQLARANQVTLNTVLQSAWALLLGRYNGTEDVVFGSVTSGRPAEVEGVEEMVGLFINTVPIRVTFRGDQSFSSLIQQVQQISLETQNYDFYPLAEIQNLSTMKRNLINHIYAFQNYPVSADPLDESEQPFSITELEDFEQTHYDFNLILMPRDGLEVKFKYNATRYDQSSMDQLFEHYEHVLNQISQYPNVRIREISIITDEESRKILYQFNDTAGEYPRDQTIVQLFERQAERVPSNTALVYKDVRMTYGELNANVNRLASRLRRRGVGPGQIVGLIGDRTAETVVGMLGILKAGGAYLPMDPEYPADRMEYMLHDSHAKWIVTPKCYADIRFGGIQMIILDEEEREEDLPTTSQLPSGGLTASDALTPSSLAYVMYTSGSTGQPKGVMVQHRNVVRLVKNTNYVPLQPGDRILQTGAPVFDACTFEIWGALLNGLELYMIDKESILDAEQLGKALFDYGITTLWMTSPLFNQLAQQQPALFRPVRHLIIGGDVVSPKHIQLIAEHCEKTTMINGYGPTENTTFSTCHVIRSYEETNIPIGKPIAHSTVYVVDMYGHLSPIGIPGEMWVGGDGVALGYINNEALTSEKFMNNPFVDGDRVYRTGDAVRWLPDGAVEFIGRLDQQVKIRGFRVEIGEIENRIQLHEGVKEAAVKIWDKGESNKSLCAYVVCDDSLSAADLKENLSRSLPDYMIPTHWTFMDQLPLNPNGKVHRQALPEPEGSITYNDGTFVEPRNESEQKLAEIWSSILAVSSIGANDHFFDLGGHSLTALKLITEVKKQFQIQLPLQDVFNTPVLSDMAALISGNEETDYSAIEPALVAEFYPVSSSQKRLFILNGMAGMDTAYNMPFVMRLEGCLDVKRLEFALQTLISRHESLRTSFHLKKGEPIQRVHESVSFDIKHLDAHLGQSLEEIVDSFVAPFDLGTAPLLRAGLAKLKEEQHVLIIDIHHIVADGSSIALIVKEFSDLYNSGAESSDNEDGLGSQAHRIQYKDYAVWQNTQLGSELLQQQERFWLEQFADEPPVLNLLTDYPRPQFQSFEGAVVSVNIDRELSSQLKQLASDTGATLYMILFAAYSILLGKYASQEDIVIGSPTVGRSHADVLQTIGMFVNTIAIRVKPEADKSFAAFLNEVKQSALQAFEHQDYPYEELVEKLGLRRDMSRNPLFDTVFTLQNIDIQEAVLDGLTVQSSSWDGRMSKFDLTLTVTEKDQGMAVDAEFAVKLFKHETITRMLKHFVEVLREIAGNGQIKLADIELLSAEERDQVLIHFNGSKQDFEQHHTAHELFAEQAERTPEHIAVVFKDRQLTYRELDKEAARLASILQAKGFKAGQVTAILIEHSIEMIVAVLGVLKAGGAYVPIDHEYPEDRIAYILEDSGAGLLLTKNSLMPSLDLKIEKIDLEEMLALPADFEAGKTLSPVHCSSSDLAYMIYTSGSTGKPKGVMIEHRSLLNMTRWYQTYYKLTTEDKCTKYAGFGFDASVWEIFPALLTGSELHIIPDEIRYDVHQLVDYYNKQQISVSFLPTAVCEQFCKLDNDSLRVLITGGDKLRLYRSGSYEIVNNYGPTENTIVTTAFKVNGDYDNIPIGKPIDNVRVYILDPNNKLLPVGVPGELCIAGESLARGYMNRPDLTAEKFTTDPFYPGERMYKTGDLARWLPEGNLEYLGRMDEQVKIRGYRIELGEIENVLLKQAGIHEAVVTVVENLKQEKELELCAYVSTSRKFSVREMREFLALELPEYMLPVHYVFLDKLPLTANGKVDRRALPEPDFALAAAANHVPPRSETEQRLAELWSEVLSAAPIGAYSHFFEIGGHSLKAATLTAHIREAFHVDFPLSGIFQYPVLEQMAESIDAFERTRYSLIGRVPDQEYYPVSSAQKRLLILNELEGAGLTYNMPFVLQISGNIDRFRLQQAFDGLIRRHEVLRTSFDLKEGELVQIVHPEVSFAIEQIELADDPSQIKKAVQQFVQPFHLQEAPLIRTKLASLRSDKHILMIDLHHTVSDGASVRLLVEELGLLYNGEQLAETATRIEYKDYAVWQSKMLQTEAYAEQEQYWLERFSGELPVLTLPTDYQRPPMQSFEGDAFSVVIDIDLSSRIREAVAETGTTLYMFLLAGYNILLSKYANQEDVIVGTPTAGRWQKELETVVGMFVNTLAIRNRPEGDKRFKIFLEEVKEHSLQAFENQLVQYEDLLDKLYIKRDVSRNPLFDTMFAMDNVGIEEIRLEDLHIEPYPFDNGTSKFDLMLTASEDGSQIRLDVEYAVKLFRKDTVERMIAHYVQILRTVTANLEIQLSDIGLLLEEERRQIIEDFNCTTTDYPRQTIHELFEEQAVQHAERIAVVCDGIELTYGKLNAKANQLAKVLRDKGIGPDRIVAVMGDRTLEMIIGMLAILKSGGAYLPIDPDYPKDRIEYFFNNSGAKLLLVGNGHAGRAMDGVETIVIDHRQLDDDDAPNLHHETTTSHLAYIMYTSGSTGLPKGVMVEHLGVSRLVRNTNYVRFTKDDRVLQTAAPVFDVSVFDIWGALLNGARLYLVDKFTLLDTVKLETVLRQHRITALWLTSPLFTQFAQQKPDMFRTVNYLIVGGDILSPKHIQLVREQCKHLTVVNGYGPTENTSFSCCFIIEETYEKSVPIGPPISNSTAYIVDKYGNLNPIGVSGELWVGGDGVARGYMNNEELTSQKFIPNPFVPGDRIYRTGDAARWLPDGSIEFIGRIDNQVKIRGFRVEIGEIENALLSHPAIKETVILVKHVEESNKFLCAYVVADVELTFQSLKGFLAQQLPDYMIPSVFIFMEQLPLNVNGKVDRKALPEPEYHGSEAEYTPPRDEAENTIVQIWSEILGIDQISVHSNFFELGGHSLKAMQMVSNLAGAGWDISINQVFAHQTPAELAAYANRSKTVAMVERIADISRAEQWLSSRLRRTCKWQTYFVEDAEYVVVHITGINETLKHEAECLIAKHLDERIHPHYLIDENEQLHLQQAEGKAWVDCMLDSVARMQESYASGITSRQVVKEYPISPSQIYHFIHKDVSGTMVKWNKVIQPELLRQVLRQIVSVEEVMRSVLVQEKEARKEYWQLHESPEQLELPVIDISHYERGTQADILRALMDKFFIKQYTELDPLMYRVLLVKQNVKEYVLLLPFSHTIFDYMSNEVLRNQVLEGYELLSQGRVFEPKRNNTYTEFIEQITKGPEGISPQRFKELFDLPAFGTAAREVTDKIQGRGISSPAEITIINHCIRLAPPHWQHNNPEVKWEIAVAIFAEFFGAYLDMQQIPAWMTHFGRQYEDKSYFDIVGECIDYIPMLLKRDQDMNTQSEMIRQKLQAALDHNIHFTNLVYNESADSSFTEARDSLTAAFEEMPINFNYLGELSEEADLDYLDAEGVNCDDPHRILFMSWCKGDQIHITLVIPAVEDKDSIRSKLDEAARKPMKESRSPRLKGVNI
ncbi:non-ribosomal peptide synthetase [Paenibacillus sp.]|uniref:non-ribosomal peptide synthetase n=1 Tax=Paenibacillus sp. TaxID=58172 RepID=UPI002836CD15|nr:non-ribosomal peptide synthetase [Paenibacillus sp.]MDR0268640.1 amino acid adenylation domain-containing protein [Paenibacillus sp.]